MFYLQHEVNTRDNRVGTEMLTRGAITGTTAASLLKDPPLAFHAEASLSWVFYHD